MNKERRNFWRKFDTSKTNSCYFHNFHINENVGSSIPREYVLNVFCLCVAANPIWLESCTPIGNVKKSKKDAVKNLNKCPLFCFFNVAFYSS